MAPCIWQKTQSNKILITDYKNENSSKEKAGILISVKPIDAENEVKRREVILGKCRKPETKKPVHRTPKTVSQRLFIKKAFKENFFFRDVMDEDQLDSIVDVLYEKQLKAKQVIYREGEEGSNLYISAKGTFEKASNNSRKTFSSIELFGELALLHNIKRDETVRALTAATVWILEQEDYERILVKSAVQKSEKLVNFLRNVPKLNTKSPNILRSVADLLELEFFTAGTVIIRQGDRGDKFYIINKGSVTINRDGVDVAKLLEGEYFGERALLLEDCRQASVIANSPGTECFTLPRAVFIEHFGDIDLSDLREPTPRNSKAETIRYSYVKLTDLEVVATLGQGAFGKVELVQYRKDLSLSFALKRIRKQDLGKALDEKNTQRSCNSPFLVDLYKTFADKKYFYFMMDLCLGGELWFLLQQQPNKRFEEPAARFYAACILEALACLHEKKIIFRDLKPENMLLDTKGYLKLADFGVAKKLNDNDKSYTLAGTAEYIAPEIILYKGHNKAVDYWSYGVFIYELLVGKTPFRASDSNQMRVFHLILGGIENANFPPMLVSPAAQSIIKKLCKSRATERLGCLRNGVQDIRDHGWFSEIDWQLLREQKIPPPFARPVSSNIDTINFRKLKK